MSRLTTFFVSNCLAIIGLWTIGLDGCAQGNQQNQAQNGYAWSVQNWQGINSAVKSITTQTNAAQQLGGGSGFKPNAPQQQIEFPCNACPPPNPKPGEWTLCKDRNTGKCYWGVVGQDPPSDKPKVTIIQRGQTPTESLQQGNHQADQLQKQLDAKYKSIDPGYRLQ